MATSDDQFSASLDMNTAMLKFLNDFYGTANQDFPTMLNRFLQDNAATSAGDPTEVAGTAADSTRAWNLLTRAARGLTS